MPPDARVARFLDRARRRLFALAALQVVAVAAAAAALALLIGAASGAAGAALAAIALVPTAAAGALAAWHAGGWRTADEVEKRVPIFRNALVTAGELLRDAARAKPHIRELVLRDTAARIDQMDLRAIVPARRAVLAAASAVAALAAVVAFVPARTSAAAAPWVSGALAGDAAPAIASVEVRVTPPSYTGEAGARYENPDRVTLIEGSHVAVRAQARADSVTLTAGARGVEMTRAADGAFEATLTIADEAFLSLLPSGPAEGARAVIQLAITPDVAPDARIHEPGRDLMLADAAREIPIRISARDDFGLTSLVLAYTKVSGSGESFEFVEGTLPLTIARAGAREWSAIAAIRPAALGLAAGDMLVYRAVARDAHPSRGAVESDAFVIEIVSASEAMAEGFSIDEQRDTYALSQQMIIIKTERLMAARRGLDAPAIAERAAEISAEQRRVRAEFVFMMGGEVEDEEVEAEHASELEEGREQNRGRRDLLAAIRSMSDASALLMRPDLDQALTLEKRALASLQRAFTRSRYILRVLSQRERIDDSRRLSGDRSTASSWRRAGAARTTPAVLIALRQALVDVSALARRDAYTAADRARLSVIAESLLRVDPPSARAADAAGALTRAAREQGARAVAALVDEAALHIDAALETPPSTRPPAAPRQTPHAVRSALADRMRGGSRR